MKLKSLMLTAGIMILTVVAAEAQNSAATTTTTTTTTSSPTGDHLWNNPEDWWKYEKHPEGHLFNAKELTLDVFGTYLNPERHIKSIFNQNIRQGTWGGGVGANYFWSRDVGLSVDTSFQDGSGSKFVDHVGGNLVVRFPVEALRLAPYIFGGGGYKWNPNESWFVDFGPGLEFRFNKHLGVFGDASYIFLDKPVNLERRPGFPEARDQLYFRVGLRAAF